MIAPTVELERADLFERVDRIAEVLEADADAGDVLGRLPDTTIDALRSVGLLALKMPRVLGGFEAEPALQYEIFERVAYHNIAAGWCLFIYADTLGMITARISDAGLAAILDGHDVPVTCGGGGLRPGTLEPAEGGMLLSGQFRYGSGIHAAQWVLMSGLLAGDGRRPQVFNCVLSKDALTVHDTWNVHGLKATGSHDFSVDRLFVPHVMIFPAGGPPLRGGRQYRTGVAGYLSYTVPAVCGAVARRGLDELIASAAGRVRGYTKMNALSSRAVFQRFVGEADTKLSSARSLMLSTGTDLMEQIEQPGADVRALDARTRAAAAFATRVATDVVHDLVRFTGGDALRIGHFLEKGLRDVTMAASHLLVNEVAYENHAQFLLGIPGADPLA